MAINRGKTIVLTIHQPGFRILELLDRVILLSSGFVLHNGSLKSLENRLKVSGHCIPPRVNVLEFAIDVSTTLIIQTPKPSTEQVTIRKKSKKDIEFPYPNSHFEEIMILTIAGPSGAGKTTLLDILAGNISSNQVSGHVLINNHPIDTKQFRRLAGYVTQDDALFPSLTVEETLMYSAFLRLRCGRKEAVDRVKILINELGLDHVSGSRIGEGSNRGISGGERRRVSIGVELVHDPSVILIDEPTSGLDSGCRSKGWTLGCQTGKRLRTWTVYQIWFKQIVLELC
nr:ABC transporter G family member 10 [Tanacetum cinerariifolium]